MNSLARNKRGFTIIELSIVLVVVSLLLSGALSALQATSKIYKDKVNKQKMQNIKIAIQNFFARNGRLPYPANPTVPYMSNGTINANFGLEDSATYRANGLINFGNGGTSMPESHIVFGVVPAVTLGLPPDGALDAYGNEITYVTTSMMAENSNDNTVPEFHGFSKNMYSKNTAPICPNGGTNDCLPASAILYGGNMTKSGLTNVIMPAYNITIANLSQTTPTVMSNLTNDVAYAIISHGPDGYCAWQKNGTNAATGSLTPPSGRTVENNNCSEYWTNNATATSGLVDSLPAHSLYFYNSSSGSTTVDAPVILYSGSQTPYFDDYVLWDTIESLFMSGANINQYATTNAIHTNYWEATDSSANPGGIYYTNGATQNIGIGVKNPKQKLDVSTGIKISGTGGMEMRDLTTNPNLSLQLIQNTSTTGLNINQLDYTQSQDTPTVTTVASFDTSAGIVLHSAHGVKIDQNTQSASYYPLYVSGVSDDIIPGRSSTIGAKANGTWTSLVGGGSFQVSIMSAGAIVGSAMSTQSDARIKENIKSTNNDEDLQVVNALKVTNYNRINSTKNEKKLIAQDVEKVYPMAVSYIKEYIPNLNNIKGSINSVLASDNKDSFVIDINFDNPLDQQLLSSITINDNVKFSYLDKNYTGIISGVNNTNIKILTTDQIALDTNIKAVNFYGTRVDDFRIVDYDAISMLNVSAIQSLSKRLLKLESVHAHMNLSALTYLSLALNVIGAIVTFAIYRDINRKVKKISTKGNNLRQPQEEDI